MATSSVTPSTPTGQKAQAEKKTFASFIGVDEANAGFGFADDLAAAAALRREAKGQTATTAPKA
jgi:hypothetical protein